MWCGERSKHLRGSAASRALGLGLSVGLAAGSAAAAEPVPPTLKIWGATTFTTETRSAGVGFEVRVRLVDEVGRPLPRAEVRAQALPVEGDGRLNRCGEARSEGDSLLSLSTDVAGQACIAVRDMPRGTLQLVYEDARGYFARASHSVALPDSAADGFEVGFDPPLSNLALDQPLQRVGLVARAREGAAAPEAAELVLSLVDTSGERELTRVALDGLGEVHRLSIVSATFGAPGPARLVARLRGRGGQERASATLPVLCTATVALRLATTPDEGIEPGDTLQVSAASAIGPVPSGVIEARSAGRSVAAARVQNGAAALTLPALPAAQLGRSLTLEYVGDGPGWLAGSTLEVAIQAPRPSYGRYALWILAAALTAFAVVLGWRRPPRPRPAAATLPPRQRASVEVIESFGEAGGYRGLVCDAHDGTPISPAVLSFIGPGPSSPVLMQVRTNADGSFTVDTPAFPAGAVVEVTAPLHATLTAPLPGPGVLQLSLIGRRRALLNRLVQWAERRGKPWLRSGGDPTPAQVASVAEEEHEQTVGRWARAVEHLAYGPNPPDAGSEQAAGVVDDPKLGRE